jgi:hypothetical protein
MEVVGKIANRGRTRFIAKFLRYDAAVREVGRVEGVFVKNRILFCKCSSRHGGLRFRPRPQRFRNRRRSETMPRMAKRENAGMGRKTPFRNGH